MSIDKAATEKDKEDREHNWDDYLQAYYEKPASTRTWSGYPVKEIYTPEDGTPESYKGKIGDAGTYPFTRGIHRNMFRGRYWTRR
jgi:methylmalonyl-CoA mutase N-terminal domain/subunit